VEPHWAGRVGQQSGTSLRKPMRSMMPRGFVPPIHFHGADSQSVRKSHYLRRLRCLPSIRDWMIVGGTKLIERDFFL
jgi:hypothetical protein